MEMISSASAQDVQAASFRPKNGDRLLFWGCFTVLVASAFGFVFRSFLMDGCRSAVRLAA